MYVMAHHEKNTFVAQRKSRAQRLLFVEFGDEFLARGALCLNLIGA